MVKLYKLEEVSELYVDAIVGTEEKELLFLSVWGLDTAIQEFIARLSLPWRQGGIDTLTLTATEVTSTSNTDMNIKWYSLKPINRYQKHSVRVVNKDSLFNHKIHLWLYDELSVRVDNANHRCLLLKQHAEPAEQFSLRLWQAVKTVCPVPLLNEWKPVVENFQQQGWIQHHQGITVDAYTLDFSSQDVESRISAWIRNGQFVLPKTQKHLALVK